MDARRERETVEEAGNVPCADGSSRKKVGVIMGKGIFSAICAVIMLLIGALIIVPRSDNASKVESFNVAEYGECIAAFPSKKILGPVDRAETAREKAEVSWVEIYGESVKEEKPYQVFYDAVNETWLVSGTLQQNQFHSVVGGVANILIQEADGKVLAVWHDK